MNETKEKKMEVVNSEQEKKHLKLMKAYQNNVTISDMNLSNKYTNFEDSKLDESKTLLYEITTKPNHYKRFSSGQIVKIKFGVNIGSEFSGEHYAIVISKKDTMVNPVIHVIPLTSKKHNYNIEIDSLLYDETEINNLKELLNTETNASKIKNIKKCIKYYENKKGKKTYACIKHLKTVSKLSVCKLMSEYDYLDKLKISTDTLKMIDEEIIKEYTI